MRVYFSINKNKKIVNLPYVEEDVLEFDTVVRSTEEIGNRIVMGNKTKAEVSFEFDYPKNFKKRGGLSPNGFLKFIQDAIDKKKIIRVVAVRDNGWTYFNKGCVVESLKKKLPRANGDIPISISFKER